MDGIVADQKSFNASPLFIIPETLDNELTNGVYGVKPVWLPEVKALKVLDESNSEVNVETWLKSTKNSFIITDLYSVDVIKYTEGDEKGSFDVAVTATKNLGDNIFTEAYIIACTNVFDENVNITTNNANLTLFTNILGQSVDESVASLVVPPKTLDAQRFIINNMSGVILFIVLLLIVPIMLLLIGFIIWNKRRKR